MNLKEYILTCIGEEGGEISQAASKCLRFGMVDFHPQNGMQPNSDRLVQEVNDLIAVVELLGECGYANIEKLNSFEAKQLKKEKFYKYLGYSKDCGTFTSEIIRSQFTPQPGETYCKGDEALGSQCGECPRCTFHGWVK